MLDWIKKALWYSSDEIKHKEFLEWLADQAWTSWVNYNPVADTLREIDQSIPDSEVLFALDAVREHLVK